MGTERNSDSFGDLVGELSRNLSTLIRGEIALVRLEIRNAIAQLGLVVGLFIVAGLLAFCGYIFFLMMLHSLFVQLLGKWLGQLVVMAILFLTAGVIVWVGVKRLDQWKVSGVQPGSAGTELEAKAAGPNAPRAEESSDGVR